MAQSQVESKPEKELGVPSVVPYEEEEAKAPAVSAGKESAISEKIEISEMRPPLSLKHEEFERQVPRPKPRTIWEKFERGPNVGYLKSDQEEYATDQFDKWWSGRLDRLALVKKAEAIERESSSRRFNGFKLRAADISSEIIKAFDLSGSIRPSKIWMSELSRPGSGVLPAFAQEEESISPHPSSDEIRRDPFYPSASNVEEFDRTKPSDPREPLEMSKQALEERPSPISPVSTAPVTSPTSGTVSSPPASVPYVNELTHSGGGAPITMRQERKADEFDIDERPSLSQRPTKILPTSAPADADARPSIDASDIKQQKKSFREILTSSWTKKK